MEDEVIADIARRVKKTGRYTETAELMAKSMAEQGYSAEKIQAEVMKVLRADRAYQMAVAENTKAYKQEIQDIIDKTVQEAKASGDTLIAEAGNMAWNNDLSMWQEHGADLKKPNNMSQLILAFQKQTRKQLRNLTRSMGFVNTVFGTTGIANAYQREMDLALLKVATGAFSYDQAVNDCVKRLAKSGLRSIDYAGGRSYQLDTAARMCVRTGMSQLAGKIMEENLKSTGQDLVITSQHMGSRPEHAVWQNKVFSYSGKNKKYPDFVKSTGYGTVTGLKGANCTHDFYPFWEGASIIPEDVKEPKPVKVNGREYTYYQATQQQRKMERDIRAIKREIEAQKAVGGDTAELEDKLRVRKAEYQRFSNAANLKVKNNRLRIVGGSSQRDQHMHMKTMQTTKPTSLKPDNKKIIIQIKANPIYKELSIEDFKAIKHSITKEERSIIYGKSHFSGYINSSNAKKMNEVLRQSGTLPDEYRKVVETLQNVIDKNTMPDDIKVVRYVTDDTLKYLTGVEVPVFKFGMSKETYWKSIEDIPNLIKKDTEYTEKGFLSTSGVKEENVMKNKGIRLDIKVPKGTNCYITTNYKESEIIFGQNTTLKIIGSRIENNRTANRKVVLECIIENR